MWWEQEEECSEVIEEYEVIITPFENYDAEPVAIRVWTWSLQDATMCGEVLSAIYF
jgi:hypothetical protein